MATTTTPVRTNPYIGPRSFETGERLFGRDRELRDLLHLLIAERVVLLYSPSGAGKSSLIKAALIPALAKKSFVALPPVRVNQELPPGAPPEANRYVYSTLLSLEDRRSPAQRLPLAALAALRLPDYLLQHILPEVQASGSDPVLIFDQFEELLTVDPASLAAKHAFFEQLGQVLADRRVWALVAMREDYLAALDPYLEHLPTRFKDTFRLDLLGAAAARQAMQGPARAAGVTFAPEAAAALADELRRTLVQRPDGSVERVLGPYVEPVQLQVVCLRLWDRLFDQPAEREPLISLDDITDVGDVDSALAGYYVDRVQAVAAAAGVGERDIRDWFDRELITPQGQRSQVMRGAGQSAGLDNAAIMGLIDAHLLRADERHGIVWYELAHDRLVGPVQQSNAAWRLQTLTPFQRQAILWEEQQRAEGLLIQGAALREAERWAEANAAALTESERAFLEASRKARAQREEEARTARLMRRRLVVSVVAGVLAVGLSVFSLSQYRSAEKARQDADGARTTAEQQTRIARVRQLAAQAVGALPQHPQRSLLLAAASQQVLKAADPPMPEELANIQPLIYAVGGQPLLGSAAAFPSVFSPDGRWVAARSEDGHAKLWRAALPALAPLDLGVALDMRISADGRWLATLDASRSARLWRLGDSAPAALALPGAGRGVRALALSPDGRWLATSGLSETLRLWRLDTPAPRPADLARPAAPASRLLFSPDGRWLVAQETADAGAAESAARLWSLEQAAPAATDLGQVAQPAFSPDGRWLVTAGQSAGARLWRLDSGRPSPTDLGVRAAAERPPAFSANSAWLSLIDSDQQPRLWRLDRGAPGAVTLALPAQPPAQPPSAERTSPPAGTPAAAPAPDPRVGWLGLSPDSRQLIGAGQDGVLRRWQLGDTPVAEELGRAALDGAQFSADGRWLVGFSEPRHLQLWPVGSERPNPVNLGDRVGAYSLSPDGGWLALSTDEVGALELWKLGADRPVRISLRGHEHQISAFAFGPDGGRLVSFSQDEPARLWQTQQPIAAVLPLGQAQQPPSTQIFSPDGRWLATSNLSGSLRLWQIGAASPAGLDLGTAAPGEFTLRFSPDGRWLLRASPAAEPRLWRLDGAAPAAATLGGLAGPPADTRFSPDGRWLLAAGPDTPPQLWRLDGQTPAALPLSQQPLLDGAAAFSPDGRWLALQNADGQVQLWRLDGARPSAAQLDQPGGPVRIAFSPDGRWLSLQPSRISLDPDGGVSSSEAALGLWDMSQSPPARAALDPLARGELALRFSPDSRWLVLDYAGATDAAGRSLWLQPLGQPPQRASRLSDLAPADYSEPAVFSPDSRRLAVSAVLSGKVRLWRLDAGQPAEQTVQLDALFNELGFSPDGAWLYARYGHALKVWPADTFDTPAIDLSSDASIQFSPNSAWAATSTSAGALQLWLLAERRAYPVDLPDSGPQHEAPAFSPDGRWLAALNSAGAAQLWLVEQSRLGGLFCGTAGRNLSLAEWQATGGPQTFSKVCLRLPYHASMFRDLLGQHRIASALGGHASDRLMGASQEPVGAWLARMASEIAPLSPRQALLAYTLARQIDPALQELHPDALSTLCRSSGLAIPGPLALEVCARALALQPDQADLFYTSAVSRLMTGDLSGARADLEQVQRLAPTAGAGVDPIQERAQSWLQTLEAGKNPLAAAP